MKSGITYVIFRNYTTIKVDSYDSMLLEKTLTFHNFVILIKSVFNKDKNKYCSNMFLGKDLHETNFSININTIS